MKKIAALALVFSLATSACLSSAQKAAAGDAAAQCAAADITGILNSIGGSDAEASAESVLMSVISIVASGATGWEVELIALGTKYGAKAIVCAVQIAEALFNSGSASSSSPASTEQAFPGAHDRAVQFLSDHPAGK